MDIERYRQRLLETERELVGRLGREVEIAREASDDQADVGDLARVGELKDEYFALADNDSAILAQVRAALKRIEDETFGLCIVDGQPIEEKRLDAVPWTPYCVKHQQMLEEGLNLRSTDAVDTCRAS